ncbi:pyrroline-5-carboxylate reductase [Ureibacillus sinduriensis]|uniref:Pyrroline-5-carboxylate reductase n=1 Tax=Ureibacillus sinduriensis BLB-1 = JCM 15800 TaxID=1384057 RepID=A0A0A3HWH9_9BACL|nr:pyrroline-5-carboxylate reductase [Ureibacillus sinduriensis]KGR74703.1 pyrroline-5-carboxylate reductase [Ureibacillus sinduriensis BLB-1 = JCM 15800]
MQKILFVGAGSMAEALIQGWVEQKVIPSENIYVTNRSKIERLIELSESYAVNILDDNEKIRDMDLIILAMKPKDIQPAMERIQPFLNKDTAVLSVLAGIPIHTIEEGIGNRPIARVMPNTSATIGMSASGIAFNERVDDYQKVLYLQMMEAIGIVIEVEEDKLHAVTALSGSGPAYLYYLLEAWEAVGSEFGLSKEVVRQLMVQTIAGSAAMLQSVKEEPTTLRRKVTSPGGTTEAGITALENNRFNEAIYACIKSAEARSRELAKGQ